MGCGVNCTTSCSTTPHSGNTSAGYAQAPIPKVHDNQGFGTPLSAVAALRNGCPGRPRRRTDKAARGEGVRRGSVSPGPACARHHCASRHRDQSAPGTLEVVHLSGFTTPHGHTFCQYQVQCCPQKRIASITTSRACPFSVRVYSTLGGTLA